MSPLQNTLVEESNEFHYWPDCPGRRRLCHSHHHPNQGPNLKKGNLDISSSPSIFWCFRSNLWLFCPIFRIRNLVLFWPQEVSSKEVPQAKGLVPFAFSFAQMPKKPGAFRRSYYPKLTGGLWINLPLLGMLTPPYTPFNRIKALTL